MTALRADRVRRHTSPHVLRRIDARTTASVEDLARDAGAIEARLRALHREWDTDRVIELEASLVGMSGLLLGFGRSFRLLGITLAAGASVLAHAASGWYPLLPLFRGLGFRSAREIARERHALKAVRGDFETGSSDVSATPQDRRTGGGGAKVPATQTRVQQHTRADINATIRAATDARVARLAEAPREILDLRIAELEREWDVERVLQANASTLIVVGTLLGMRVDRRFLAVPFAVLTFFGQHALQGWCPPLPVLRRLGVRTVGEIERERYALKTLRGDFTHLSRQPDMTARVRAVLDGVDR